jgi:hypothetical protein
MRNVTQAIAIPLLGAALLSCGGEQESKAPTEPDSRPEKKAGVTDDQARPPSPGPGAPPPSGDTSAGAEFLAPGAVAPADHKPIGAEDREALASVYISFVEDPEGFVGAVQKIDPDRRNRIAGYLLCAADKLRAAGKTDRAGAPVEIELPIEAKELIRFEGSPDKARSMFLRQLAGEFLVVGRAIQSIDKGETKTVEQILARQHQSLEMMKVVKGPEESAEWSATLRRVYPILFARLIPEC